LSGISQNPYIPPGTIMGKNVVIEDNVIIGENVVIGHNVIIRRNTRIGNNVVIGDNTVLGKTPYKASLSALTEKKELPGLVIKDGVIIGACCVIYAGAVLNESVFVAIKPSYERM